MREPSRTARCGQVAYVEQEDTVLPTETPRESMDLSAKLRLPKTLSDEDRKGVIDNVIDRPVT
jgi:ABC-type multidrug transport system ATPase subunit